MPTTRNVCLITRFYRMVKRGNTPLLVRLVERTDLRKQKATNKTGIYLFQNHCENGLGNYTGRTFLQKE